jgi:molecular chaperone GrpE
MLRSKTIDENGRAAGDLEAMDARPSTDTPAREEVLSADSVTRLARDDVPATVADEQEQLRRLQADFANFRRRATDSAERAAHDRAVQIVTLLLPVIGNFERAIGTETIDAAYTDVAGRRIVI